MGRGAILGGDQGIPISMNNISSGDYYTLKKYTKNL